MSAHFRRSLASRGTGTMKIGNSSTNAGGAKTKIFVLTLEKIRCRNFAVDSGPLTAGRAERILFVV